MHLIIISMNYTVIDLEVLNESKVASFKRYF